MTSPRYPPIPPSSLTPTQQPVHDLGLSACETSFADKGFTYKRADGALLGPYALFVYTPLALVAPLLSHTRAVAQLPGLPPDARETAMLTVAAHFHTPYITYAHSHIAALPPVSLSATQIQGLSSSNKPDDLDEACSVAYDVAVALCKKPGPLYRETWLRAEKVLGRDGTLGLVHFVGLYAHMCMLMNAADVGVPEDFEEQKGV